MQHSIMATHSSASSVCADNKGLRSPDGHDVALAEMACSRAKHGMCAVAGGSKLQHEASARTAMSGNNSIDADANATRAGRATQYLRFETMSDSHSRVRASSAAFRHRGQ